MRKVARVIDNISTVGGGFAGVLVFSMMLLIMYEVFMRYVLNNAPGIADEIGAYMLISMSFLALAWTMKEKGHVRVEALVSKFPSRAQKWVRLATLVLSLALVILISQVTLTWLLYIYTSMHYSTTWLRLPLYLPGIFLPFGFVLLALQLIVEIGRAIVSIRSVSGEKAI